MRPTKLYKKKNTHKTRAKRTRGYRAAADAAYERAYEQLIGSQGGASPARKKTGEVIKQN
jgi:hypothetical protein